MIYFDNAATTFPKPLSVSRAMCRAIRQAGGNPGRGAHSMARAASDLLYSARETVANHFGAESENVRLNKIGSDAWQKTKAKARKAAKDMAGELIQLYAARKRQEGYAFAADTPWQAEFEENFPYAETDDQLRCIADIKNDMESPIPMDRLLCGDVGYGKTEVALRAAFKAVSDGKQVAILVPTTILALQHYETALARMRGFPVTVEVNCINSLPQFEIVGLPDSAVRESRERLRAACTNAGVIFSDGALTVNLAPADKLLYALRDVTATVDSLPLIASSIMGKKLAADDDCILLDVKTGSGAFMKSEADSRALAEAMVDIGKRAGKRVRALITDMDRPLGCAIGNSLEVIEAIDTEDPVLLREELGDVLLQVVFHAQIAEEEGRFNIDDITNAICEKMIRRHPHVFADVKADDPDSIK